jgi:D-serine deaminase-like pyridoxal phosphate-dependent protein
VYGSFWELADPEQILTPALAISPARVVENIDAVLRNLGPADRWQPHAKTFKMRWTVDRLLDWGVRRFKCATVAELELLCDAGVDEALLAMAVTGAAQRRVRELARRTNGTRIGVLVDHPRHVAGWRGADVALFVDVDTGMHRTGIAPHDSLALDDLVAAARRAGQSFAGIHSFEGHVAAVPQERRAAVVQAVVDGLVSVRNGLEKRSRTEMELVAGCTPSAQPLAEALSLRDPDWTYRLGCGTPVYRDLTSDVQLGADFGGGPAAAVLTRVVSRPLPGVVTCDAGSKAVSVDPGLPHCAVYGRPDLEPQAASEEHLRLAVAEGTAAPQIGEMLALVPRHVCTTVGTFDHAILVEDGRVRSVESVGARGRGAPVERLR